MIAMAMMMALTFPTSQRLRARARDVELGPHELATHPSFCFSTTASSRLIPESAPPTSSGSSSTCSSVFSSAGYGPYTAKIPPDFHNVASSLFHLHRFLSPMPNGLEDHPVDRFCFDPKYHQRPQYHQVAVRRKFAPLFLHGEIIPACPPIKKLPRPYEDR